MASLDSRFDRCRFLSFAAEVNNLWTTPCNAGVYFIGIVARLNTNLAGCSSSSTQNVILFGVRCRFRASIILFGVRTFVEALVQYILLLRQYQTQLCCSSSAYLCGFPSVAVSHPRVSTSIDEHLGHCLSKLYLSFICIFDCTMYRRFLFS